MTREHETPEERRLPLRDRSRWTWAPVLLVVLIVVLAALFFVGRGGDDDGGVEDDGPVAELPEAPEPHDDDDLPG